MKFSDIAELIQSSQKLFVATGAGISVNSGIPDFRGKKGLYQSNTTIKNGKKLSSINPETILSHDFFFKYPQAFYEFYFEKMYHPTVQPNSGHKILAEWEKNGKQVDIITQNIDGLHTQAGSQHVIEYHGSIHTARCYNTKCQKVYTTEELIERSKTMDDFYICDCGKSSTKRYIKPDVVLFDERGTYFSNKWTSSIRHKMVKSDLIIVLGSSLKVFPFRSFIDNKPYNKPMVIINKEQLYQSTLPNTYTITEDISTTMEALHRIMNNGKQR